MREMEKKLGQLMVVVLLGQVLCTPVENFALDEVSTDRLRLGATEQLSLQALSGMAGLGARSSFRYSNGRVHTSSKGVKHVRLMQTYGGSDVIGSSVVAEMDMSEQFTGQMYGNVVKNIGKYIPDPDACQQNVDKLLEAAIQMSGFNSTDPAISKREGRRFIYALSEASQPTLAYKIQFFYSKDNYVSRPLFMFDACSVRVLKQYESLQTMVAQSYTSTLTHDENRPTRFNNTLAFAKETSGCPVSAAGIGGNTKTGRITYNNPPYCLNVDNNGDVCYMDGTVTKAVDNKQSDNENNNNVVEFICEQGYPDEEVNGGYGSVNDAFYGGEYLGDLFTVKYAMRPLTTLRPRLVVHYSSRYENAFFDGKDTFYGDGMNNFYPLVSLDVVTHELGHGITDENSALIYEGMSGGMNEAFSDLTGATAATFASQKDVTEWAIGEDIVKGKGALRYMDDPTRDGKSIKSANKYKSSLNVHYSSGVFNYAFFSLVSTEGMNIYEAYKCFLDANLKLWKSDTDFYSGSCNVMQAAYENGFDYEKVVRAFAKADLDLESCKLSALSTTIFPGEIREEILVSKSRSPILKVDLDQTTSNATVVEVDAQDGSEVKLVVGQDDVMTREVTSGVNAVRLDMTRRQAYVQLVSTSEVDTPVTLHVRPV